jgi:hypothetical protein
LCNSKTKKSGKKGSPQAGCFSNFLAIDFSICVEKNLKKILGGYLLSITIDRL